MTRIELRSALACAASGLALVALPAGAAGAAGVRPRRGRGRDRGRGAAGRRARRRHLGRGGDRRARARSGRSSSQRRTGSRAPRWHRSTAAPRAPPEAGRRTSGASSAGPGGIRVSRAWDRLIAAGAPGGAGTTVAIVDTGLAYRPASGGYLPSPDFAAGQFVSGIDLVDDDDAPLDENGHGTHVAGTIAEQVTVTEPSPFDDYLTGIAYGATLMPVRVLDRTGAGSAADVGEGILWAARNGADIINVSLQFDAAVTGCAQVPTVCDATREARRSGALVVAAAGNALGGKGERRALYPGAAPGVLAVGATTEHGCLADYSHYRRAHRPARPGRRRAAARGLAPGCAGDTAPRAPAHLRLLSRVPRRPRRLRDPARSRDLDVGRPHAAASPRWSDASGVSGIDPTRDSGSPSAFSAPRGRDRRRSSTAPGMLDALRATDPDAQLRSSPAPLRWCGRCRRRRGRGGRSCSARCRAGSAGRRSCPCCRRRPGRRRSPRRR